MSAAPAGKFQDHYLVLGVDPKANSEAIHAAYTERAKKFHPQRGPHADAEKYNAVTQAYEVLSDLAARAAFDTVRSGPEEEGLPRFSGEAFFSGVHRFRVCRNTILSLLYDRRYKKPRTPGLSMRQLEAMMTVGSEELQLAVWYLKQRNYIYADDRSTLNISVQGMDAFDDNPPSLEQIEPLLTSASGGDNQQAAGAPGQASA